MVIACLCEVVVLLTYTKRDRIWTFREVVLSNGMSVRLELSRPGFQSLLSYGTRWRWCWQWSRHTLNNLYISKKSSLRVPWVRINLMAHNAHVSLYIAGHFQGSFHLSECRQQRTTLARSQKEEEKTLSWNNNRNNTKQKYRTLQQTVNHCYSFLRF